MSARRFACLAPRTARGRAALDLGVLAALGLALVALTRWQAHWPVLIAHPRSFALTLLAQLAVYGLAAAWVIRRRPETRRALVLIFVVALAARAAFVIQAPTVSNDIYRYVWDGRVQARGINPYRYAPDDPALARYRDAAIYPYVNRKDVRTIYPPAAEAVFRAVYWLHPDSVAWTRLAFALLDLLATGIIAGLLARLGQRPERALLYAWHPLLILEVGHSGHVDVVAVLLLLLALRARLVGRPLRMGFWLAGATLVKFYAIVALPALLWPGVRRAWRRNGAALTALVATVALAYLPFLGVGWRVLGYLPGYLREEGIESGRRFYLLQRAEQAAAWLGVAWPRLPATLSLDAAAVYAALVCAVMAALALWCWLRPVAARREVVGRAALLFVVLLVLATPTYPWYTLLALAFVPLLGRRLLLAASVVVGGAAFLYLQWWLPGSPSWPRDLVYGGDAAVLAATVAWAGLRASDERRATNDEQATSDERRTANGERAAGDERRAPCVEAGGVAIGQGSSPGTRRSSLVAHSSLVTRHSSLARRSSLVARRSNR